MLFFKYHPDRNTDKDSHAKFVKVVAAYKVLSKPESRLDYDLGLVRDLNELKYDENIATNRNPWSDPSFWHNRKKEHDTYYSNQPYYGIKGIKKVSNLVIVLFCLIITFIGVGLQVYAIRLEYYMYIFLNIYLMFLKLFTGIRSLLNVMIC